MVHREGRSAHFNVVHPSADQAYVMIGAEELSGRLVPMRRIGRDRWQATLSLAPGAYRYRYYLRVNGVVIYHAPHARGGALHDAWDELLTIEASDEAVAMPATPAPDPTRVARV